MTHDELRELVARAVHKADEDAVAELWPETHMPPLMWDTMHEDHREDARKLADAIISALDKAGMVVVPMEPTLKMSGDGSVCIMEYGASASSIAAQTYRAMIAAWKKNGNG